jgi:hypothetical protein
MNSDESLSRPRIRPLFNTHLQISSYTARFIWLVPYVQVGASVLSRALARLPLSVTGPHVVAGLATPDDAALIR